jgi:hypothetical protein
MRRIQRAEYARWRKHARLSAGLYAAAAVMFLAGEIGACLEIDLGGHDHGGSFVVCPALGGLALLAVVVPLVKSRVSTELGQPTEDHADRRIG